MVYTIADLHLSETVDKPMDKFGGRWQNYAEKLSARWRALVEDGDTVVIPGDISWAMSLEEAAADLRFLDALPGRKLIGKGNHDFWWETVTKMKRFFDEIGVTSIDFLYNNAHAVENFIVCGTRGWYVEERFQQKARNNPDYKKIVLREASRLTLCLKEATELQSMRGGGEILAFFHFPPVFGSFVCQELIDVLKQYGITRCYYGHIHGVYNIPAYTLYDGIRFDIISADYLNFTPLLIRGGERGNAAF